MTCPKCGHKMVLLSEIGLKPSQQPDAWICSANMPYQGCGHRLPLKM